MLKMLLPGSDFKAEMYQNRFRLWLCPRLQGSLQRSHRPCSWKKGTCF